MDNAHEFLVSKGIKSIGDTVNAFSVQQWLEEYATITNKSRDEEIKLLEEREVLWSNKKSQLEEEIAKYVGIAKSLMIAAKEIERLKAKLSDYEVDSPANRT